MTPIYEVFTMKKSTCYVVPNDIKVEFLGVMQQPFFFHMLNTDVLEQEDFSETSGVVGYKHLNCVEGGIFIFAEEHQTFVDKMAMNYEKVAKKELKSMQECETGAFFGVYAIPSIGYAVIAFDVGGSNFSTDYVMAYMKQHNVKELASYCDDGFEYFDAEFDEIFEGKVSSGFVSGDHQILLDTRSYLQSP